MFKFRRSKTKHERVGEQTSITNMRWWEYLGTAQTMYLMKGWVIMKSPEEWEGTRLGLAIPIHTQLRLSNQGQGWWWCHLVGWCWCCCCCWALPSRKWQGGSALTSSPCLSSSNLSSGTAAPVLILHQYTKCTQYTYIYYTYNVCDIFSSSHKS